MKVGPRNYSSATGQPKQTFFSNSLISVLVFLIRFIYVPPRQPSRSGIFVFPDGTVLASELFEGITQTTCASFSFVNFPIDLVNCSIEIMTKNVIVEVDLRISRFIVEESGMMTDQFIDNSEIWRFDGLSNSSTLNYRKSQSRDNDVSRMLSFELHFSRKSSLHYLATILIPIVCLNLIQNFAFCLPPESERSTFAMTTVLAYYVVLGTSYSYIPQTSETVILVVYAIIKLVWSTGIVIYMLITALFINYYTKHKVRPRKLGFIRKIDIVAAVISWTFDLLVHLCLYLGLFHLST